MLIPVPSRIPRRSLDQPGARARSPSLPPPPAEPRSARKRKYPIQQFKTFWAVTKRYAELTRSDALIHRSLAGAVNGLVDFLEVERKRVPGLVLRDAERLECLLFSGYDPHFEGDEPPGL